MKSKIMNFLIFTVGLFIVLQITILANDVLRPKHNVATTTTNISVFDSGRAIVNVRYIGYQDITSGAEITLKIEQKKSLFWKEVVSQTYKTDEAYHSNKFDYPLQEMGTYRFTVSYTVSGSAGEDDVIRVQEEKIYDETCPEMPPLRSGEDYNHDCTLATCCEYCYPIIGESVSPSHKSNGTWKAYDDDYHYSTCSGKTVSYVKCMQILKEKHRFDENNICKICGYKKLTFVEVIDEENKLVTIIASADGGIETYLSLEYLEPDAYEVYYSDYMKITNHKMMQGTYRVHIPFEDYERIKKEGIQFYLYSQNRRFYVRIYPQLDPESFIKEDTQ